MTDQVFMSPNNGALCVGVPLFKSFDVGEPEYPWEARFSIALSDSKPLAYVLDMGDFAQVLSAEWVESKLICLGDL